MQTSLVLGFSVFAIMVQFGASCVSSGVCGSSYCAAPPAISCSASSCQPGYSCGQYGCARNRARSSLTKKVEGIFIDDSSHEHKSAELPRLKPTKNNIFGLRREKVGQSGESAEQHQNLQYANNTQYTNPNFIFRQCCEQRGLPDACLNKCHFNAYTKDALQGMYFKTDGCPLEAAADMHFCAAQGRDHTQCCARNGVATTLAGAKCLTFCDQRPDRVTKLDYSYVPCYDRFENMKQCFYNEIKTKAEKQFGIRK
ncbi:unnamed protein product [Caenorhabditis angaria]|uniref:Domain of unknown function DB domain-containing protein n=1 Tax=Caenorhabditis angaria TaxID=860376 RepID=A0A9P1N270_9PELO|nr:unnamed protein product [Caenorhabditis angaria]